MKKLILLLFIPLVFACDENKTKVTFVKIGNQIWSDENLSVDMFRNGDKIKQSKNIEDWFKYNGKESNFEEFKNLYESQSDLVKSLLHVGMRQGRIKDALERLKKIDEQEAKLQKRFKVQLQL